MQGERGDTLLGIGVKVGEPFYRYRAAHCDRACQVRKHVPKEMPDYRVALVNGRAPTWVNHRGMRNVRDYLS